MVEIKAQLIFVRHNHFGQKVWHKVKRAKVMKRKKRRRKKMRAKTQMPSQMTKFQSRQKKTDSSCTMKP